MLKKKDSEAQKRARSTERTMMKAALEDFKSKMLKEGFTPTEVREHLENEGFARRKPEPQPMPAMKRRYDVPFRLAKRTPVNTDPF